MRPITIAAIALALGASAAAAQERSLEERLDSIAGQWIPRKHAVGMVAAVVKGGDTLLYKAYGLADVEWEVPMTLDAQFEIGSQTKQFTAAAILKLRDEGKLSLDDEVEKWVPEFDARGRKVTLRHLLSHTSGIADFMDTPEFAALMFDRRKTREDALPLLSRYEPIFEPGEQQFYNNSGFWLLGLAVERASGIPYENYIESNFFEPLGMTRSMYCNIMENVPRRAHGYFARPMMLQRSWTTIHTWPFAAGSLCSTAGDLLKWIDALHGGRVLSPESTREMITPARLNDGTELRYGMGLQVGPDPMGTFYIGHGGRAPGYWTEAGLYPESDMAIVVLMNSVGDLDPQEVVAELAAEVLGVTPPEPKRYAGNIEELLGRYVGQTSEGPVTVEVVETPDGPGFRINGSPPRPGEWMDGLRFKLGANFLIFRRASGDSGPIVELRRSAPGAHLIMRRQ